MSAPNACAALVKTLAVVTSKPATRVINVTATPTTTTTATFSSFARAGTLYAAAKLTAPTAAKFILDAKIALPCAPSVRTGYNVSKTSSSLSIEPQADPLDLAYRSIA
ncbi:hypothetical protein MPSEU_000020000 [Mayamaea pseudoterrestris]|nr:hypothetical protein MPSEU_000020000 [Mayamaea pseudoterrestris]